MIDSTQRKDRRKLSLYGKIMTALFGVSNHCLNYLHIVLTKDPFVIGCCWFIMLTRQLKLFFSFL